MANDAIVDDTPVLNAFQQMIKTPEVKHELVQTDKLANLSGNENIPALYELIDGFIEELREFNTSECRSVNEVGFRYLAHKVAIKYLERVREAPENARRTKEFKQPR